MTEREALLSCLDDLKRHGDVEYADARFVENTSERIRVRDGRLETVDNSHARGVGVRVIANGAWGFASTNAFDAGRVKATALAAREVARASARAGGERVRLAPLEGSPARGTYASRVDRDPFAVPLDEKVDLLARATRSLLGKGAPVRRAEARMGWTRQRKVLVTSDGVDVQQTIVFGGAGMFCVAIGTDGRAQRRSYPTYQDGEAGQGGYERIARLGLDSQTERVREEAIALLTADPLPVGKRTVILESSQLALQVHESCGHPTELDRAFGTEISLAGGSFLQPSMLGNFRYGSPIVTIVADATCAGGLGTFGWDDEGTPARRMPLVQDGMFVGYLSSRETAAKLGTSSSGSMRADGASRIPLIRMVNINLEPDPKGPSLEQLIADTDDGLYLSTNKSWSIDDLRLNFQFGCEAAWEIKHGKRVRLLRDPVYTGVTPTFWAGCDAICSPDEWHLWGVLNCGKGEPMQAMGVGHGTSPSRFRDVEVGHG
jgi:TldD protein